MADWDFARAITWAELADAHARWVGNYNEQIHWAHRQRTLLMREGDESMAEPTRDDVIHAIREQFPHLDSADVLAILDGYGADRPERERVQFGWIGERENIVR